MDDDDKKSEDEAAEADPVFEHYEVLPEQFDRANRGAVLIHALGVPVALQKHVEHVVHLDLGALGSGGGTEPNSGEAVH